MIDTRAVGQELQDQVLAAARKGQQRVTTTIKTITATAEQIRPQLPSLPKPTLNMPSLPKPGDIRQKAPALAAMLPSTEQLKAGAHEVAGQVLSAQRRVLDQVRSVTSPLAHQAEARQAEARQAAGQVLAAQRKVLDQIRSITTRTDAREVAKEFLAAQRKVLDQVRSVTTPLGHQAAAVFTQVGKPTVKAKATVAELTEDGEADHGKTASAGHAKTASAGHAKTASAGHAKTERSKAGRGKTAHAQTSKAGHSTTPAERNGGSARKPTTRPTAK